MFTELLKQVNSKMKFTLLYLLFQESPEQSGEQDDYKEFCENDDLSQK
jgi:hypothetical protein